MALPGSGQQISFGQLRSAYGALDGVVSGQRPVRLSNAYGTNVLGSPSNTQTKLSDFWGLSGIDIPDPLANGERLSSLEHIVSEPNTASTGFHLITNFDVQVDNIDTGSDWAGPGTLDNTKYEVFLETDSVTNTGGAIIGTYDTWLALSSNRVWSVVRDGVLNGIGTTSFSGTLKIRAIGDNTDIFTTAVNMIAEVRRS